MANKNTAGNLFKRAMIKETRLVKVIDKREAKGTNRENTDSTYNNFRYAPSGERVWHY
jgi:hypothetical protein